MNTADLKLEKFHFGKSVQNLFTIKELECLLNLRPFLNKERLVLTEDKSYSWFGYSWQTDKDTVPASIIKQIIKKDVAYIRDAGKANEKINNMCKELEIIFNRPVDCHIYFSFKKNVEGFKKHNDQADNFIVLCEGEMKVEVWSDEVVTKIMKPGDYVFIPKNIDHRITPLTDKRLSCSFPILQHTAPFDEREWLRL